MMISSLVLFAAKPQRSNCRDVSGYAQPAGGNGNEFTRMYEAQPDGMRYKWMFIHHETARGAIHVVPLITDKKGRTSVLLQVAKRPPLGGQLSVELPGGLWGDCNPDETRKEAAHRELREETGYKAKKIALLSRGNFATSSGSATEEKAFALAWAGPKRGKPKLDEDEKQFLVGEFTVPLKVFMNPAQFERRVAAELGRKFPGQDYIIGMDVPAARGLMPPLKKNGKLNLKA